MSPWAGGRSWLSEEGRPSHTRCRQRALPGDHGAGVGLAGGGGGGTQLGKAAVAGLRLVMEPLKSSEPITSV